MLRFGSEPIRERMKKIVLRRFLPQNMMRERAERNGVNGEKRKNKSRKGEKNEQQNNVFDSLTQAWLQFLGSFWAVIVSK